MIVQNFRTLHLFDLTKRERKAVLLSSLWSMLEFYDFLIFGFMGIYFSEHISRSTGLGGWPAFQLFAIFILGYLVRPLGMALYSKVAPNYNSKIIGSATSILLFLSTTSLGFIPEYNALGIHTMTLVILARLIQGIAGGAEMQAEYDHLTIKLSHKVSFAVVGILLGNEVGQVLAISINRILNFCFNDFQMESFGWRLPFFFGGFLTLVVYCLRIFVGDALSVKHCRRSIVPAYKLFSYYPNQTIIAITLAGLKGCTTFFYLIFMPLSMFYILKYDYNTISRLIFLSTIFSLCISYIINQHTNFDNSARAIRYCIFLLIPSMILWVCSFSNEILVSISILLIATLVGLLSFLVPRAISGLFPSAIRLSGVTFSHHHGFVIFGGLAPLVNIALVHICYMLFPNLRPAKMFVIGAMVYILLVALMSLISLIKLKKYANYQDLNLLRRELFKKLNSR